MNSRMPIPHSFMMTLILSLLTACGAGGGNDGGGGNGATAPTTFTLTIATTGNGEGEISPGSRTVTQGQTTTFTLTPAVSSDIASASGCGGSLSGNTYTTGQVNADCTVSVTFALKSYGVTANSGSGGRITPTSVTVEHGSSTEFSLSPEPGYEIAEVSGCEGTLEGTRFITGEITGGCQITATFEPLQQFRVTATATGAGSIEPPVLTVLYGDTATFHLDANSGNTLGAVSGCGGNEVQPGVFVTAPITQNCDVRADYRALEAVITGRVNGHDVTRPALVTLTSREDNRFLAASEVTADGDFRFENIETTSEYVLSISQTGVRFSSQPAASAAVPATARAVSGAPTSERPPISNAQVVSAESVVVFDGVAIEGLEQGRFSYRWSEDVSVSGAEYASYINEPLAIEVVGPDFASADTHAAVALHQRYGIVLSDADLTWSAEHAFRLLEMVSRTGVPETNPYEPMGAQPLPLRSRWELTARQLPHDLEVSKGPDGLPLVTVSSAAFTYATPLIVSIEGQRGRFFSNRLFKAVVRFVTDDGRDLGRAAHILRQRYGIRIATDEYFNGRYDTLPVIEADRSPGVWQTFQPVEVIELIAMLEEFPEGMRDISFPDGPGGLRYILRRRNGLPHPLYPEAPAVAWTGAGYIEFLETGFMPASLAYIQRLIIHEKAHFMWDHLFSVDLKYEWLKMSGWYRPGPGGGNCEHWYDDPSSWSPPNVSSLTLEELTTPHVHPPAAGDPHIRPDWASCSTTQFVTAYAAALDPNEDMAESIAFFMTNPDMLRSTSLPKYEFIRDFIMQGAIFVSVIRPDLTFEVLNLYPDYVYPGKINRVEIDVDGGPEDDKEVSIVLGLHVSEPCQIDVTEFCLEGASGGFMRVFSPTGSFVDTYLSPLNRLATDSLLETTFTLPDSAPGGWWTPREIVIFDQVGNRRIEKLANADFGWRMYVDTADPDVTPPQYIQDSMQVSLLHAGDPGAPPDLQGDERELVLRWRILEARSMDGGWCFARITNFEPDGAAGQYSHDRYGEAVSLDANQIDGATHNCEVRWRITRFVPGGEYGPGYIAMRDRALNEARVPFAYAHPTYEAPVTASVFNPNPDTKAPVLVIDECQTMDPEERCLRISAEPVRPDNPDGETIVRLSYWAWEDQALATASGVSLVTLQLRNPQGQEYFYYHGDGSTGQAGRSPSVHQFYFRCPEAALAENPSCDATTPVRYVFETRLPVGSAPGRWGLTEMTLLDHAGNRALFQFTETLRFEVD